MEIPASRELDINMEVYSCYATTTAKLTIQLSNFIEQINEQINETQWQHLSNEILFSFMDMVIECCRTI